MYNYKLVSEIEKYIDMEIWDSLYYKELSKIAPSKLSRKVLEEFSRDEKCHRKNFIQAYYYITGRVYSPKEVIPIDISDYKEALKQRLYMETCDYKKYGNQYIDASNMYLRNLFFTIRTSEANHAMRIPVLLEELKECP